MYNFKQQGNYIYIDHVDGAETINYVGLKKDVKIIPTTVEPTAEIYVYDITTLYEATNSHSSKQLVFDFSEVTIDGVAPTITDFITWVTSNSGNFNSPSSGGTGATLASELTVTPAVNGLSNAQAVLTNHETRIDTLEASSSGGSSTTNLTTTQAPTTVTVNSDTGTDATIVLANGTNAGVSTNDYTTAEKSKLAGIATGATANSSDATLLDRANHTGTQTASTISDFNTSVDSRIASSSPDLSFLNVAYASTISRAYDDLRPNLEIDITGNLDFTLTGTSSGKSGILNLYFSGTQVATLNGVTDLVVTGAGEIIPVYFVHDSDGIKWYKDEVGGATVDTSLFAIQDGTVLYHTLAVTNTGTFSNTGNVCTGTGTTITAQMVGSKIIKSNGEVGIIATRSSDTSFTTVEPFATNSTNTAFEVFNRFLIVNTDGTAQFFDANEGYQRGTFNSNGTWQFNGLSAQSNNNVSASGLFVSDTLEVINWVSSNTLVYKTIFTFATLPTGMPAGTRVAISDATTPTYYGIASGGGSITWEVMYDGTTWRFH